MSKKKSKKEKELKHKRILERREKQIEELEELKAKAIELEKQLKAQRIENMKELSIRNLKIFGHTCNFLVPFVISMGVTIGVFSFLEGGYPFSKDEIVRYNTYSLDYQSNGYLSQKESYESYIWTDLPVNKLIIYTPWQYENNEYVRYKRSYYIGKLDNLELFDAVLEENYDYVEENLKEYDEEKQIVNNIEELDVNNYYFEASLHMRDKQDILKYEETDLKNIIITIVELVLGLGIGAAINHARYFDYLWEVQYEVRNSRYVIKATKPMKKTLNDTNQKILSLSKKVGKMNEK